ncbi:MAG: hypothetical protein M3Z70_02680 [Bartonella sp.]|nr:hypothetical protein [Bartonella sp.]
MNVDEINNMSPDRAAAGALKILSQIDCEDKETQAMALAITLLSYTRRHSIEIGQVFTAANNMLYSCNKEPPVIALQNYVANEL